MGQIKFNHDKAYFGAANGYQGFRSRFGEIFDSYTMEKIYVLKGGPGTGKSTLLKKVLGHAWPSGYFKEAIFCSSDPDSLDGAIISNGDRRVAILDGTAPHERDAVIPGAVDEIINLGEGFDIAALDGKRDEIRALTAKKKSAYKSAYSRLGIAGKVFESIKSNCLNNRYYIEAEIALRDICASNSSAVFDSFSTLYTSAFCSRGHYKITHTLPREYKHIRLGGDGIGEYVLMQKIMDMLPQKSIKEIHLSPLSDEKIERIITADTCYEITDSEHDIYLGYKIDESDEGMKELLTMHDAALRMAESEFKRASYYHFELEKLYGAAMSFSVCEAAFRRIIAGIDSALAH